jgi:hypothetical protein
MQGLIRVLQDVTILLLGRVRQFSPLQGGPAFFLPLSTQVPGSRDFSEVQLRDVERPSVRRVMSSSCSHLSPVKLTNSSIKVTLRLLPTP